MSEWEPIIVPGGATEPTRASVNGNNGFLNLL